MKSNQKKPINKDDVTVITGPRTRLSYAHLFEPHSFGKNDSPKYSSTLIIPKDDSITLDRIHTAVRAAYEAGKNKLRRSDGSIPSMKEITLPLHDGDEDRPNDPAYESAYYVNAKSIDPPALFDQTGNKITNPSDLYSGCYARCKIQFYAYNYGDPGIAVGLLGLRKVRDGKALGGSTCTADDFAGEEDEEEDVDDEEDFLS